MKTWFLATLAVLFLLLGVNSALALETETKKNSVVTNMGLYGGQPEDIAVNYGTDNVYIALFSSGGLYYSNDAAATWQPMSFSNNDGVAKSVEVDQSTGDVYAVIGDDLLKSTDNGASMTRLTDNTTEPNFGWGMTYGSGRLLVATNNGGVIVSTDGGATFSTATIESGSNIVSIAASPTNNTFYATAEDESDNNTLYESIDGGLTWTDMNVHSAGVTAGGRFYRVGVDPLDANHIVITSVVAGNPNYQTFNGGTSWTALEANGQEVSSGYVDWDGQGRMFTSQAYTVDATATPIVWTEMSRTTPLSSLYFDQLMVDRGDPEVIYTNTGLGLAKSIDRGTIWTDNVEGITAVKTYAISQANDKDVLWIGANGGLARSLNFKDAEPTWEYPILPADTSNWKAVWVKPANTDYVVAASGPNVYYTENGTATTPTWTHATTPEFSGGEVKQIVSRPGQGDTLNLVIFNDDLGGTDSGAVWQSTDAGKTWTDLSIPNDVPANCLSVAENGAVYVGLAGDVSKLGVYKYSAKGAWSRPSTDLNDYFLTSILVDQENNDVIYTTTQNGFYTSEDKGVTWTKTNKGLKEVSNLSTLTLDASTNPDTIYVAGQDNSSLNGAVYKKNGDDWEKLYTGLKQESFYALLFDGLITGNDRGLFEIKSRPVLKLKSSKTKVTKGEEFTLTATLKDKATKKKLKKKTLRFYKKKGDTYRFWKKAKTGKKGKARVTASLQKNKRFKVRWVPKKKWAEEYSRAAKTTRVRVKN